MSSCQLRDDFRGLPFLEEIELPLFTRNRTAHFVNVAFPLEIVNRA